jgi:hypothetical protein
MPTLYGVCAQHRSIHAASVVARCSHAEIAGRLSPGRSGKTGQPRAAAASAAERSAWGTGWVMLEVLLFLVWDGETGVACSLA